MEGAIREAMELAGAQDYHKMVAGAAPKLESEDDGERLAALALLAEGLENEPELARNLKQLGVVRALVDCMKHRNGAIRRTTAEALAFGLPNNPLVQAAFREAGLLDFLCDYFSGVATTGEGMAAEEWEGDGEGEGKGKGEGEVRDELEVFCFISVFNGLVRHDEIAERICEERCMPETLEKIAKTLFPENRRIRAKFESFQAHWNYRQGEKEAAEREAAEKHADEKAGAEPVDSKADTKVEPTLALTNSRS